MTTFELLVDQKINQNQKLRSFLNFWLIFVTYGRLIPHLFWSASGGAEDTETRVLCPLGLQIGMITENKQTGCIFMNKPQ